MPSPQVNGDVSSGAHHSAFFQHLLGYPVISDGVETFKTNEYGQKSIKLGDSAYQTFAKPVLPLFERPYQYVSPYVQKVDNLGDKTLQRIDEQFPIIKKPTTELYNGTKDLIFFPYRKSLEGKDHVLEVYVTEYKKNEQAGLIAHGKAAITTALVVSNETLTWLSHFLSAKKDEASRAANDKINQ